jgi:hypothetical protein
MLAVNTEITKVQQRLKGIDPKKASTERVAILCRIEQLTTILDNANLIKLSPRTVSLVTNLRAKLVDVRYSERLGEDWLAVKATDKIVAKILYK